MTKRIILLMCFIVLSISAFAHFQMIYTPETNITEKDIVNFKIMFTHPADGEKAHSMDIGLQEIGRKKGMLDFYIVHKGRKKAVKSDLVKSNFGKHNSLAYDFALNKDLGLRGGGDWGLIAVPYPYYEGSEDIYIQQITKVFVNKAGMVTDWPDRLAKGYPEIIPKSNPMEVWKGNVFKAQVVDCNGKPVKNAEIEVEYLNTAVNMEDGRFVGLSRTDKNAALIFADDKGYFNFIPPVKGHWGFAALGAGGDKLYNGKVLSEDAVLWIEVR